MSVRAEPARIEIPPRQSSWPYLGYALIALTGLLVAVGYWATRTPRVDVASLRFATVAPASAPLTLWVDGRVVARRLQNINSSAGGVVRHLPVKVGDRIEQGALIARLDNPALKQRADELSAARDAMQAQALQSNAEAKLRMLELEAEQTRLGLRIVLERSRLAAYERLRDLQSVASIELEAARMTLASSEAELVASRERAQATAAIHRQQAEVYALQLAANQAAVDELRRQIAELEVTAPLAGQVQALAEGLSAGSVIAPGGQVATLVPDGDWVIAASVSATDAGWVKVGTPAQIVGTGATIDAEVERVEAVVRADQVELKLVTQTPLTILLGSTVRVSLQLDAADTLPHLEAPPGALAQRTTNLHVQRREDQALLELRPVSFGDRVGTRLLVADGLEAGDRVALNVPGKLAEAPQIRLSGVKP